MRGDQKETLTIEGVGTRSPTDERRALTGESETMPTPETSIPKTAQGVKPEAGRAMAAPAFQPVDLLIADIRSKRARQTQLKTRQETILTQEGKSDIITSSDDDIQIG